MPLFDVTKICLNVTFLPVKMLKRLFGFLKIFYCRIENIVEIIDKNEKKEYNEIVLPINANLIGGDFMKHSICGANCLECPSRETCPGCAETNGRPYGKQCFIAGYILEGGMEHYQDFKKDLIGEINALDIDGMEPVTELYPLVGTFVNLEYPLPNGNTAKFLKDDEMYLGAQVKNLLEGSEKTCFGVIAREHLILICSYGENAENPELVLYKHR